jgi:hypothetical protein
MTLTVGTSGRGDERLVAVTSGSYVEVVRGVRVDEDVVELDDRGFIGTSSYSSVGSSWTRPR